MRANFLVRKQLSSHYVLTWWNGRERAERKKEIMCVMSEEQYLKYVCILCLPTFNHLLQSTDSNTSDDCEGRIHLALEVDTHREIALDYLSKEIMEKNVNVLYNRDQRHIFLNNSIFQSNCLIFLNISSRSSQIQTKLSCQKSNWQVMP